MEQQLNQANLVRVHRPVLTQEEYERRMANILRSAANLILAMPENKQEEGVHK